jgi:hypothetical protein
MLVASNLRHCSLVLGRADTSVNLRSIRSLLFQAAIWKNNAAHHHRYHSPLTFSDIRMSGQVIYAAHDA